MQIQPVIEGIILGMALAIMIGPAMFALLQTSIHRGFKSGVLLASGITLSDAVLMVSFFFGFTQIITGSRYYDWFGYAGASVLIAMGLYTFSRTVSQGSNIRDIQIRTPFGLTYVLKGFAMNFSNPGVWFLWMIWVATVNSEYAGNKRAVATFFLTTLITVFSTDIIKCYIANRIKQYLKPRVMTIINRFVGVLLVSFGILIVLRMVLSGSSQGI